MDLYVANLSTELREDGLLKLFEVFGMVDSAIIIRDKDTQISKGYGFVKMPNNKEGESAIEEMNGRLIAERPIVVREANPKNSNTVKDLSQGHQRGNFPGKNRSSDESMNFLRKEEDIPTQVINKMDFTTTSTEDGLVKVKFK